MNNFVGMLRKLLVSEEYGYTEEEAENLIEVHSDVVVKGIMVNNLNATAMALQMTERCQIENFMHLRN